MLAEACKGHFAIVATMVGGVPEMLNSRRAGLLVLPNGPSDLANAPTVPLVMPGALKH